MGHRLKVKVTVPTGEQVEHDCEDVFFVNEKSYGYPERLLENGEDDLSTTLFLNPGAVLTVEITKAAA